MLNNKVKIRKAKKADGKALLNLIDELADFEKLDRPDKSAGKRLLKDSFSKKPVINVLIAEKGPEALGYAIYFFTYSSFRARKTLYLEDIFVSEKSRNSGIGKLFFNELIKIAKKNKCGRLEFVVLDWNVNAIKFYEKLGARHLHDWKTYRISFD